MGTNCFIYYIWIPTLEKQKIHQENPTYLLNPENTLDKIWILSQPNPNLNHNLNPNTIKKLGETW